MAHRQLQPDSPWLLALLAALVALGPLSVDVYLPAMPTMMAALGTDISHMHLTLSTYLTGFALFHLVCGPLADRFGRKPIISAGFQSGITPRRLVFPLHLSLSRQASLKLCFNSSSALFWLRTVISFSAAIANGLTCNKITQNPTSTK